MKPTFLFALLAASMFFAAAANAAEVRAKLVRQYPLAGAREVPVTTSIGLTATAVYAQAVTREEASVTVVGSRSGAHLFSIRLSDDARTLILIPTTTFDYDEVVTVHGRPRLVAGQSVNVDFQFHTMRGPIDCPALLDKLREVAWLPTGDTNGIADTLPPLNVLVDHGATIGTYFFANFGLRAQNHNHLFNLDQHGAIQRMQNMYHNLALDFKVHPNGRTTYFDNQLWRYVEVDSDWRTIDTFHSANGYLTDQHELLLLPNGGYALLAVSVTRLDSDQYVPGMVPNAVVGGNVIQVFDAHRNLVFEWRGIDHYRVADAVHERLADSSIDFQHANSLGVDPDGNIIISNRHLSEISKISVQTGEFIWRMGGAHNEFTMLGDSMWYSYQHCARLLPNGHMILFDNADFDSVTARPLDSADAYHRKSRAMEIEIDTAARTANVVWQYHHSPETFSVAMGSVQRLKNGHTVIGWGLNYDQSITEVNRNGDVLFELSMGPKNVSYRAFLEPVDSLLGVRTNAHRARTANAVGLRLSAADRGTIASFTLDNSESVVVSVIDALGREVIPGITYVGGEGVHALTLDTRALGPGAYFCTIRTASGTSAMAGFVK